MRFTPPSLLFTLITSFILTVYPLPTPAGTFGTFLSSLQIIDETSLYSQDQVKVLANFVDGKTGKIIPTNEKINHGSFNGVLRKNLFESRPVNIHWDGLYQPLKHLSHDPKGQDWVFLIMSGSLVMPNGSLKCPEANPCFGWAARMVYINSNGKRTGAMGKLLQRHLGRPAATEGDRQTEWDTLLNEFNEYFMSDKSEDIQPVHRLDSSAHSSPHTSPHTSPEASLNPSPHSAHSAPLQIPVGSSGSWSAGPIIVVVAFLDVETGQELPQLPGPPAIDTGFSTLLERLLFSIFKLAPAQEEYTMYGGISEGPPAHKGFKGTWGRPEALDDAYDKEDKWSRAVKKLWLGMQGEWTNFWTRNSRKTTLRPSTIAKTPGYKVSKGRGSGGSSSGENLEVELSLKKSYERSDLSSLRPISSNSRHYED
ncbi:hypothetical protein BDP27DRAFT_1405267 [Rhodocollybia butyracea]|uniref:Uncharacterized protein n=1 Tax=Rhodocollybia butyracea TaxID=206335 RepID=A0A9P5U2F6_9AGAR|nr:hypothetical protein BDP27DRAFT_1405267 [Rhodocollybia butyracea]